LLTHIADLRGASSVIFAMEEPEIALPPHSQRRITRYLRKKMAQAIITSHSPYVIEEFKLSEILALGRDGDRLSGHVVPTDGIRARTLRVQRRQLAEAILARAVVVGEGISECTVLAATSTALETLEQGQYDPFDVTGISLFAAGGRGEVPKWGPFFDSLGKKTFAFYDRPAARLSADDQAKLGRYSINQPTAYAGLEDLLVAEIPVAVQRVFLQTVMAQPDCPPKLPTDFAALGDDDAKALVHSVLCQRKGDGYSAMLIEHCSSKDQLPPTIVAFLAATHKQMKLPPLDDEAGEGPARRSS
jgi:putative ATP-dependent endonuclease of OLD family